MTGKNWLMAGIAVISLSGTGCVSCGNQSYAAAHEMGVHCDIPTCQRNRVYVFAVGGMTPGGMLALESLRAELNRQGFAKIATGQTIHTPWMANEMRSLRAAEPDAVFVILGADGGAAAARRLAAKAQANGVPIAGMVFLGADGTSPAPELGVPVVMLDGGLTSPASAPLANRLAPTTDPQTVAAITGLLQAAAQTTPPPMFEHVAQWWYPDAPPARPMIEPGHDWNWAFLFDQPGTVPPPIEEENQAITTTTPPAPIYTSVVR